MSRREPIDARTMFLACFFLWSLMARAQDAATVRNAGGVDFSGMFKATRVVDNTYPVSGAPEVSVSNRYGAIRVGVWDSRVVRVTAVITAGGRDRSEAEQMAQSIEIRVEASESRIDARTVYPEVAECSVDYDVVVPEDATLILDNFFGDTFVRRVGGDVTLDARFGAVDLRDIGGLVRVRARGEFPLVARGLRRGGVFVLRSTQASFSEISGSLNVVNYFGSIEVRSLGEVVDMDVTCESGPVHFYMPEGAQPDLDVSAIYGAIESDVAMDETVKGHSAHARIAHAGADQRIALHTSFNKVYIHQGTAEAAAQPNANAAAGAAASGAEIRAGEPIKAETTEIVPAPEGMEIHVNAIVGDIRIEGVDEEQLHVTATRLVRIESLENAQLALEGLVFRVVEDEGVLRVTTTMQEDMTALGCTSYRVDLVIQCPRTAPLYVEGANGTTYIGNTGGAIYVRQAKGTVSIEHAKGVLDLVNRHGGVEVSDCAGPVAVTATQGIVTIRNVYGDVEVNCVRGTVVVDSPRAGLTVHNRGGDVRIIALEGVAGDYEVIVEDGNLSMVVPQTTDATFWLNVHGGYVRSAIPVTGAIEGDVQTFRGRLNNGSHRVYLETRGGNIVLD